MTVAYKAIKISEKEQLVDFSILVADPNLQLQTRQYYYSAQYAAQGVNPLVVMQK